MKPESNQRKKKLNQVEIKAKIDSDLLKRYTHLFPSKKSIEFKLPEKHNLNRFLFHSLTLQKVDAEGKFSIEGSLGEVLYYHIPSSKHKELISLFNTFNIPEGMHNDLTVAYLSMFFSHCLAFYETNFNEEFETNQRELFASIDFLENCTNDKIALRGISFEFNEVLSVNNDTGKKEYGNLKSKKFKGYVAVQFIESILTLYKQSKGYDSFNSLYDIRKKYGKSDSFMGHKNAEKHSQSYFSTFLLEYLTNGLYSPVFQFLGTPEYEAEVKKLKALYSRRKIYLFIGKLMKLSELLTEKENGVDDEIIEVIEKKLTPLSKAKKSRVQGIKNRNENSTDGTYEITKFSDLF